ncbi:SDR family NAD(P)-dependent oxidoreductase [Phytohabitans kaempferiae]|uniref:SDR family NAD(P)-dependent oxidoreductase n=1 Tax=Phytohabitans kaempferiae TaxID=1620943 RepID=A0ABV6M556_9ACTN
MLVLVTGGTGFVGAHTVAALTRVGHSVRLLARDVSTVEHALAPLGVSGDVVEVMLGDVTDQAAVSRAVRGADAVLHAAGVYTFDSRRHRQISRTNVRGTELVLSAARRFAVGRSVYVSTVGAMLPVAGGVLRLDSPPGRPRERYLASKAAAEALARQHQAQGDPVTIVYPPALLGPHDPRIGDQTARLRYLLRGMMPVWPDGGFPLGDVRDTARLLAALLDAPRRGPDRHFGPGRHVSTAEYVRTVREATGRSLRTMFLPARGMLPFAYAASLFQRVWPWYIPAEYGACYVCACDARSADAPPALGLRPRPLVETIADTVRWLHGARLLSDGQAGTAVSAVCRCGDAAPVRQEETRR